MGMRILVQMLLQHVFFKMTELQGVPSGLLLESEQSEKINTVCVFNLAAVPRILLRLLVI